MPDKWPTLSNPPIVEGLLDIRIEPLPEDRLPDLERIQGALGDYPHANPWVEFTLQGTIDVSPENMKPNIAKSEGVKGFQFWNEARTRVARVSLSGVTLSCLKPYSRFAELEMESKRLWGAYRTIAKDRMVTRVALRYINRLELPIPFTDFSEYIKTVPAISDGVPQGLAQFQMRLVIPEPNSPAVAVVTEVFEGTPGDAKVAPIIFDIDAFQTIDNPIDEEQLWATFSSLRDYKNRIFFDSITDKLKRMYE